MTTTRKTQRLSKRPLPQSPKEKNKSEEQPKKTEQRERKGKGDNERRPRGGKGRERNDEPYDGSDKPAKPADNEGRGKGRRRYNDEDGNKSERRGKGKGERRGRQHDRHASGTGRLQGEEARGGRGKYNWGDKTDSQPTGENTEGNDADGENKPPTENAPEQEIEEEEEENTMTFEEYMAAQAEKKNKGLPQLQERKIDTTEKPDGVRFDRDADHGGAVDEMYGMIFHDYDGKHDKVEEKHARDGWVVADDILNIKFEPVQTGGDRKGDRGDRRKGGKGDRKGGKGERGGRGNNNRGRNQGSKIELSDTNAFPSLA